MKISIHAPTRGATINLIICRLIILFQSTLPREERQEHCLKVQKRAQDFNPRSHERSDTLQHFYNYLIYISIHAPTRGATSSSYVQLYAKAISIHAPTRGATLDATYYQVQLVFQSTLPREERLHRPFS